MTKDIKGNGLTTGFSQDFNMNRRQVLGTALYSVKAVLSGRGSDVVDMIKDNFVK